MDDKLVRETLLRAKQKMTPRGKCPDEVDLCRFAEGHMDEKEAELLETHLVSCPTCCDYVIALNRVIHFPSEETLPEVPGEQIKKASQACMVQGEKARVVERQTEKGFVKQIGDFVKDLFSLSWLMQPLPALVRSGAVALVLIMLASAGYVYYQQALPIGVQMEVIGNTRVVTRGVPTEDRIAKIVKEGDILFSNDYCRINFKLNKDAYVYVVHHDSSGALHQLYPDPALPVPQKVKGKTDQTIPEGKDQWFQMDDHTGKETIYLLASNKPIKDFNSTIYEIKDLSREEVGRALESKARVVKVLNLEHQ